MNRCFDSIKVILCRSMLCRIVFCLADFIFRVYFGLKLTYSVLCTVETNVFIDYLISLSALLRLKPVLNWANVSSRT